jgi:hypothetical protein
VSSGARRVGRANPLGSLAFTSGFGCPELMAICSWMARTALAVFVDVRWSFSMSLVSSRGSKAGAILGASGTWVAWEVCGVVGGAAGTTLTSVISMLDAGVLVTGVLRET